MKKFLPLLVLLTGGADAAQLLINLGTGPNDGTGDPLRTALTKVNTNFTELYSTRLTAAPSANGVSLVSAANYAAMRALLDLEPGTDFLSVSAIAAGYQPLSANLTSWSAVTPGSYLSASGNHTITGIWDMTGATLSMGDLTVDNLDAASLQISGTPVTATAAQLNYLTGTTSDVQGQIDAKAPLGIFNEAHAVSHTLSLDAVTGEGWNSVAFITASGVTLTLPPSQPKAGFRIINTSANAGSVQPNGADFIIRDGVTQGAGDSIISPGALNDTATFYAITGGWRAVTNAWTSGGIDLTPPALVSGSVNGTALTLVWTEAATGAGAYLAAMNVDLSTTGSNTAVSAHASGNGTDTWVMTLASPAVSGETANLDFTSAANLIQDAAGNDAATIIDGAVTNATSGAYLVDENAESGTPAGWTNTATFNWAYATAPAPLVGSASLGVTGSTGNSIRDWGADNSDVWFYLRVYNPAGSTNHTVSLLNSSGAEVCGIAFRTDRVSIYHGGTSASDFNTALTAQAEVWGHYVKGSGANGALTVYINNAVTGTRPTTTVPGTSIVASIAAGAGITDARRIKLGSGTTGVWIYDKIRVSASSIGNSPP